jgi:putative redox protein
MNSIDKSKELQASIVLLNDKLHFNGRVEGNPPVSIDYIPPQGDNLGYTSLELFLLSLASCVGSAVIVILRKMQKTFSSCEVLARGFRKEQHPTGFRSVELTLRLSSANLDETEMQKVIALAEGICPVWSMIKGNVEVSVIFEKIAK